MTARNLTLTIGGRAHVIAVPPEDEAHITALAQMIDEKVRAQGPGQGQTEARMLLIAALMLADELDGLRKGKTAAAPPPPPPPPPPPEPAIPAAALARIADLADRVEKLATRLEIGGDRP